MTLLDCVSHEYGWTVHYSLTRPLAQLFALYSAISARYNGETKGPTYVEREIIAALRAAKKPTLKPEQKNERRTKA